MSAQLRDMLAAENSPIVPQENHHGRLRGPQRPETDLSPVRVWKHDHRESLAENAFHEFTLARFPPPDRLYSDAPAFGN
jgi:hypothetical protein